MSRDIRNVFTAASLVRIFKRSVPLVYAKVISSIPAGTLHLSAVDLASKAAETTQRAKSVARAVRPEAWHMRTQGTSGSQAPPGGMQLARNLPRNDTPGTRYINVSIIPWLSGKLYSRIGITSRAYKESMVFEEMVEDVMQVWSSAWDTHYPASLIRSEILIFWHNLVNVHENSTNGTLGEFYNIHSLLRNSEVYLTIPKKYKGFVKDPAVVLLFMIDIEAFDGRTSSKTLGTTTKRRRSGKTDEQPAAKRQAGLQSIPVALTSNYLGLKVPAKAASPSSDVELQFFEYARGPVWPGNTNVNGRLYDLPLRTGKDKLVFELEIDSTLYVAKRLLAVPTDYDSFINNFTALLANHNALYRTKDALDIFYEAAADIESEVDRNLSVLDTFIAAEVVVAGTAPSIASGLSLEVMKAAQEAAEAAEDSGENRDDPVRAYWLIQRRTGNLCDRWNLMESDKLPAANKFGTTVAAICHFFANNAALSQVQLLSHFQTSNGKLPNQKFGKLITDVVFQNDIHGEPRRQADHGTHGVRMVLDAHVCNRICKEMALNKDETTSDDDEE
ncbi:hypothetical protein K438DRAFT_1977709 [Mycena galopus ATCC 62051]|nr:hypothetical protein K438DRAFT_1977709 [Mycena galopus ATCC 62051]